MSAIVKKSDVERLARLGTARYEQPDSPSAGSAQAPSAKEVLAAVERIAAEFKALSDAQRMLALEHLRANADIAKALAVLGATRPERWKVRVTKRNDDGRIMEAEFVSMTDTRVQ